MMDIDEREIQATRKILAHPGIKVEDYRSFKRGLSIAAGRCLILKKIRVCAEIVHNHRVLIGSHDYLTKCNINKLIQQYNHAIHLIYTILNITCFNNTPLSQVVGTLKEPIPNC